MTPLLAACVVASTCFYVLASATSTMPTTVDARDIPIQYLCRCEAVKNDTAHAPPLSHREADFVVSSEPCDNTTLCRSKKAKEIARGRYNASNNDLGWDYVEITATAATPSAGRNTPAAARPEQKDEEFHAMGYLEGYLTAGRILPLTPLSLSSHRQVRRWVREHIGFMRSHVRDKGPSDPFWAQVGGLLRQLEGMADGFNAAMKAQGSSQNVTFEEVFYLNFNPESGDVEKHFKYAAERHNPAAVTPAPKSRDMHCSGLVKVTPSGDLFVSQATWGPYFLMGNRMFKVYSRPSPSFSATSDGSNATTTVTFSSYPGSIVSGDDWYQTAPHGLVVQETSNSIMNASLFRFVVPQTVSEFIRVMTANWLAASGEEWSGYFARHNSGTYNNQWMVVDFKKAAMVLPPANHSRTPPAPSALPYYAQLPNGTLWVAEQMPGYVEARDMTGALRATSFWASYNIPYFPRIYNQSGYLRMYEEQGDFWSYSAYARPRIFRRNHTDVTDLASMMRLMRYNNYQTDVLSRISNCTAASGGVCRPAHSAWLAVASRGDLMPSYPNASDAINHLGVTAPDQEGSCAGEIDAKVASFGDWQRSEGKQRRAYALSGPTNDQQATFEWGTGACPYPAMPGTPSRFDFPWVAFDY